ncbi:unnamed protein product [Paramecium octaurelia]|uniref:Uncharacterized protein n=1 Tax=Paramecium octaurelia TaxID=43137 RepID=A0A8S1UNT9_PAROT|nr:unnamed protein product [Paramecium octaurelia]
MNQALLNSQKSIVYCSFSNIKNSQVGNGRNLQLLNQNNILRSNVQNIIKTNNLNIRELYKTIFIHANHLISKFKMFKLYPNKSKNRFYKNVKNRRDKYF